MNHKDTAKVRSVQRKAEVCNNTTSYRVALVSMNPKTNRLKAHGDKGICNFITRNRNQILALPPGEDGLTLEQPSTPLNSMSKKNLRNFSSKMLSKINGGKKYRSFTVRNQPSWWDNNISPWIDLLQQRQKSPKRAIYKAHPELL